MSDHNERHSRFEGEHPQAYPDANPAGQGRASSPSQAQILRRRIAFVVFVVLSGCFLWFVNGVFQPFHSSGTNQIDLQIPEGARVTQIADQLAAAGVADSARFFSLRARLGANSSQFKAGRYSFVGSQRYTEIFDQLVTGPNAKTISFFLQEGLSRQEASPKVAAAGIGGDYLAASERPVASFARRYQIPGGKSLEGFLFPATYEFPQGVSSQEVVSQQLDAFSTNFKKVNMAKARAKNLTPYDVVTIASLIEREVSDASERKLVAAVIYNRLKAGIALGIDATVRYIFNNWTTPITKSQLASDSPYNTRKFRGLPPGPIGSPGLASLQAAADPAASDDLFYVADPCRPGKHTFVKTDAEFQLAVQKYNQARAAAGGKQPTGC